MNLTLSSIRQTQGHILKKLIGTAPIISNESSHSRQIVNTLRAKNLIESIGKSSYPERVTSCNNQEILATSLSLTLRESGIFLTFTRCPSKGHKKYFFIIELEGLDYSLIFNFTLSRLRLG